MKVNLNNLYKPFEINDNIEIPTEYYKNSEIKKLDKVHVEGKIFYNLTDEIEVNLSVSGNMVLIDAITLEDINYPFQFSISETISEMDEEIQKNIEKNQNVLDIIEILWENIVLEVPISITNTKNTQLKGDGWELNGDESLEEIDPRLAKLNDMFKGGE